jgi:uncharacterized DUF497 family protein
MIASAVKTARATPAYGGSYILFGWTTARSSGDAANRRHLGGDQPERGISLKEIEEVLTDPDRVEVYLPDRRAYQLIGRTSAARWLIVIWIDQREGRYPVHARTASKRIIRRLTE